MILELKSLRRMALREIFMNKMQILRSYFQTKRRLKWDRNKLEIWHKKGIRKIVSYAKKHSPFYRKLYGNMTNFASFPIISKKEMMETFDLFNTAGISKEKAVQVALEGEKNKTYDSKINGITVGLSSGTSGKRGVFLASEKEAALWCGNILAKTLTCSIFKKEKVALFLRANSNLYETASSFKYFPLDGDYEEIKEFDPDILVGPPSLLRKLPKIHPKKVISVAEVLEPLDEKFLEKKFKIRIDQVYQCTEGFLGFTCEKGTLHLNEDVLHIEKEYIDRSTGRFLPIITDLFRSTQPIIRYRLDDVLIEGTCSCGSSFMAIECIEGRLTDVLSFKKKEGEQTYIFPREIGKIFSSEYLLKQDSQGVLHLYGGCEKELKAILIRKNITLPKIKWYSQLPIRKDYEKLRRVQRNGNSIFV